ILSGCASQRAYVKIQDKRFDLNSQSLQEGIPAYNQISYTYKKDGESEFRVTFGEPVVVAIAKKDYGWGFFQFPSLYVSDQEEIVVKWNMAHDNAESYGKGGYGYAISKDKGKTWTRVET